MPTDNAVATQRAVWTVRKIADYWRLQRDGYLVATYNTKGAALAGMSVEKRRYLSRIGGGK